MNYIIDELLDETKGDIQLAINALCDGEYLASKNWSEEEVEDSFNYLQHSISN